MLEIKNICKAYNKTEVLKNVSIKVMPGEIHGLIGENGAGKTTLLKCAVGIYKADKGDILFDEKAVYDNPEVKERVGYMADYNEYIPYYTVAKMIHMYKVFYPKFNKEKFDKLNETYQIPLNKRISSLSKGKKMRLAFMLEVAKEPDYLLLDEPTSGLDPVAKTRFFEFLINEVEERNIGVLISSHNLDGLEKICDSVTMLHEGEVEKQMSMEDMKSQLVRLSAVFPEGPDKALYELPQLLKYSNVGSVYTLVIKEYDEEIHKKLCSFGASFIEQTEISLEELFVALSE